MTMRPNLIILLLMVLVRISVAADAGSGADGGDDKKGPHEGIMKGLIVRVDGKDVIFKDKIEVRVKTTDETEITLDGKPAKLRDLKAGLFVQVLSADETPSRIIARTPKAKPK